MIKRFKHGSVFTEHHSTSSQYEFHIVNDIGETSNIILDYSNVEDLYKVLSTIRQSTKRYFIVFFTGNLKESKSSITGYEILYSYGFPALKQLKKLLEDNYKSNLSITGIQEMSESDFNQATNNQL